MEDLYLISIIFIAIISQANKTKRNYSPVSSNIPTLLISIGKTVFSRAAQSSVLEGKADSSKIMVPKGTAENTLLIYNQIPLL